MNMEPQSQPSIAAIELLKRICKAIEIVHREKLQLSIFGNGTCCLITKDDEVAFISCRDISESHMYFHSADSLLEHLMKKGTNICFHSNNRWINICISDFLGNSIDELKIKLDLLGI